jgi:hypothetical protein
LQVSSPAQYTDRRRKMHADSTFVIGDAHKVCQDYAVHYPHPGSYTYGLLSDGCSSSRMTDVGARLLVLSAESQLHCTSWRLDRSNLMTIIFRADRLCAELFIPEGALDATLLGFVVREMGSQLTMFGVGDGVLALKKPLDHDLIAIHDIEADSGYPLYPSYLLNDKRLREVEKLGSWKVQGHTLYPPEGWIRGGVDIYDGFGVTQSTGPTAGFQVAAVFSDGVKSFVDANRQPVSFKTVVEGLLDFKSFKGEFVKRRMQGFLKEAARLGWRHDDDLSMAAVYLGEE